MAFWGVEVRPGKPFCHNFDQSLGRLRISQATLGSCKSESKSTILCNVGNSSPIALCTLIPNVCETCHLELEFEEDKEVNFSIIGPGSIHLAGYYTGHIHHLDGDDTESYGEDIAESDTSDSYSGGSEDDYESDFIDDNDVAAKYPVQKSSVVIEEIEDDDKPCDTNLKLRRLKKMREVSDSENAETESRQVLVCNKESNEEESEDEDGFPICFTASKSSKRKIYNDKKSKSDRSSKSDGIIQNIVSVSEAKENHDSTTPPESAAIYDEKPKKKKIKHCKRSVGSKNDERQNEQNEGKKMEEKTETDANLSIEVIQGHSKESLNGVKYTNERISVPVTSTDPDTCKISKKKAKGKRAREEAISNGKILYKDKIDADNLPQDDKMPIDNSVADASPASADVIVRKKKTKKKKKSNSGPDINHEASEKDKNDMMDGVNDSQHQPQSIKTRSFDNGLVVEEVSIGKPEGRKASPGKKVSVHYIGKLKNGTIFDSNIGQRPFKFRLGIGEVIKGWDVGVCGMRVGDKRRLTIPPSFGYGAKGAGKIPPNSWLVFDVELVDVQ